MKKKLHMLVMACSLLFSATHLMALPVFSNYSTTSGVIGRYGLFEATFDLGTFSNYYDPAIIDVYGEFWSPTGVYYKVNGFYHKDYTQTITSSSPFNLEVLTANGQNHFKVRFTPNEVGAWTFRFTAVENQSLALTVNYPSTGTFSFNCGLSPDKGFIQRANNLFLKRSTGELYVPIGDNVPWYGTPVYRGTQEYGTNEYKVYMDNMSAQGMNFMRIWLDDYDAMALIGYEFVTNTSHYTTNYNQKDAWQLDWIMNYAKQKNITVEICLFSHASWGHLGYAANNWNAYNPFNTANGGVISSPYDFFTNNQAIKITKNLLRYAVARWGYAPHLRDWELWNEVNQIVSFNTAQPPNLSTYYSNVATWHQTMYNHLKAMDPWDHLVTTSFAGDGNPYALSINAPLDFVQTHDYKDMIYNTSDNFQNHFYGTAATMRTSYPAKPYICGEWGGAHFPPPGVTTFMKDIDPYGVDLHSSLWSGLFSGAMGVPELWFWQQEMHTPNLYAIYSPVNTFASALPPMGQDYVTGAINTGCATTADNGLRTFYMRKSTPDTIMGWTQDVNFWMQRMRSNYPTYLGTMNIVNRPPAASMVNDITIPVSRPGIYTVKWYDAETGLLYSTASQTVTGASITFTIPSALRTSKFGDGVFQVMLDCSKYEWRYDEILLTLPADVASDVVCNPVNSQVFYRTAANEIRSIWFNTTTTTWEWSALNNAATNCAGSLAVAPDGEVFYRTTSNGLNSIKFNGTSWVNTTCDNQALSNVGGNVAVAPIGQVFFRTLDNKIHSIWRTGSTAPWQFSVLNNAASGNVAGDLAVSPNGQVFFRTLTGALNNIWHNGTSWVLSNLDNSAASGVAGNIAVTPNGQVFYKTTSNKLWNIFWNPTTSTWWGSNCDNAASSGVDGGLVTNAAGQVFYRTTSGNINNISWSGTWQWSALNNATPSNVSGSLLACDNLGRIYFKGTDNRIHRIYIESQCFPHNPGHFRAALVEDGQEAVSGLRIYPVPAASTLQVESDSPVFKLVVYAITGQQLISRDASGSGAETLQLEGLAPGLYLLQVEFINGQRQTIRFVKN